MLSQVAPDFSFLARREDAYVRALHKDEQRRQGRKRLANYATYLRETALHGPEEDITEIMDARAEI